MPERRKFMIENYAVLFNPQAIAQIRKILEAQRITTKRVGKDVVLPCISFTADALNSLRLCLGNKVTFLVNGYKADECTESVTVDLIHGDELVMTCFSSYIRKLEKAYGKWKPVITLSTKGCVSTKKEDVTPVTENFSIDGVLAAVTEKNNKVHFDTGGKTVPAVIRLNYEVFKNLTNKAVNKKDRLHEFSLLLRKLPVEEGKILAAEISHYAWGEKDMEMQLFLNEAVSGFEGDGL